MLEEVFQLGQQFPDKLLQMRAELLQARIFLAHGRFAKTRQCLERLLIHAQDSLFCPAQRFYRTILVWQTRLQLAEGKLTGLPAWLATPEPLIDELSFQQQEQEALLLARCYLALANPERAQQLLEERLQVAQSLEQFESILSIQVLLALTYADLKRIPESRRVLAQALITAQREGYLRILLDEGTPLENLLQSLQAPPHEQPLMVYSQQVLQHFGQTLNGSQDAALTDPLSPQEERVLRLLATGRSNPEIASELIVSVNTIRTQVQSIYRKLNVNNRVEAIGTARLHHLL